MRKCTQQLFGIKCMTFSNGILTYICARKKGSICIKTQTYSLREREELAEP